LALLESGKSEPGELIRRHSRSEPRLDLSLRLADLNVPTAMIDLSDGISSDLEHICSASRVGARIYAERIPFDKNILNDPKRLDLALNGGEDFELLFTADPSKASLLDDLDIICIGEITQENNIFLVLTDTQEPLVPGGFRHF